jgi:hypothetical protein
MPTAAGNFSVGRAVKKSNVQRLVDSERYLVLEKVSTGRKQRGVEVSRFLDYLHDSAINTNQTTSSAHH